VSQFGIGPVLADRREVVEERVGGVAAEVAVPDLALRHVRHELDQIIDAFVGDTHGAAGVVRVTASLMSWSPLEHHHAQAVFMGTERGGHSGIACPDDDDVHGLVFHLAASNIRYPL
jgi:hypothetical protein